MTEAQNESAKKENETGCSCGQGGCGCHDAEPQTKCACGAEAEAKPAEAKKPTVEELQAVDGVDAGQARTLRDGLSRLAEVSIVDRYA